MWGFARRSPRAVEDTPKHGEFFASDNQNLCHSTVRELSQNSGDAPADADQEVRLEFRLASISRQLFVERYLNGLREHWDACDLGDFPVTVDPVELLLVEDFGTTGLLGTYDRPAKDSGYLSFWKRYGSSQKGEDRGGRHGVGKSVLGAASRLRAFFGYTVRLEDDERLFQGQVALEPHELEQEAFDSYGQFSPTVGEAHPQPFRGEQADAMRDDFQLKRIDQPGLSLIVPCPRAEISKRGLVAAAIEHCFHQIASQHLVISVDDIELRHDTLREIAEEYSELKLAAAIDLSLEVSGNQRPPVFRPRDRVVEKELTEDHFHAEDVEGMRRRYSEGETVSVCLPVEIVPRGQEPRIGEVMLHLRRAPEGALARETYVRGRVTVAHQRSVLLARSSVGLLVADQAAASQFLGDAEPPSHAKWVQAKLREKYLKPEPAFHAIRDGLRSLQRIVGEAVEGGHVRDALKSFFWRPTVPDGRRGGNGGDGPEPQPQARPPVYEVTRISGGFVVIYPDGAQMPGPTARVEVAYAVRRGTPRWVPADFSFEGGGLSVTTEGSGAYSASGNVLRIEAAAPGFEVRVRGFDTNRDLVVRVVPQEQDELADEEKPELVAGERNEVPGP